MPGSSHSELMPGSLLGKYRIERLLGHGGMATVYLAVQEGTGLEVALKVLMFRGESNRPGGDVARFIREARLAGGIRHPHWVSVYETGYDSKQNLYYIAMERMQASLANRLRAHGPLPEAEAIAVVEQIALALDKAYETQMVHRDIKPANILYNAAGVCKLTDFGIAKSSRNEETQLTLREAVFGTPAYMSPEQAKDARMVDTRSDIYSLGTVFFELLSGERPYQGETPVQVLAQVITDKPPPDVRSKPKARKIHSDTAKLVACMMAKDPAARPQTPADLIARLQKLKAHMPYAKPEESAEEPEYDDSTIMDPTNPPPTDVMLDAGFPSDPGTMRAPTGGAGHTGMWDGAPTGGGNTGGGTGGGMTGTGGGAFGPGPGGGRRGGDEPRTAVSLPTFSTQAVRDATGTVGTVATMGTRFGDAVGRPVAAAAAKKRGGKSAAGKVWLAVAALLLLLLAGGGYFAAKNDFIAVHVEDPGFLGAICRLVYSGPPEPTPVEPLVVTEPVSLVVASAGDVDEAFEVVLADASGEYTRQATVPAFGGTCEFTQLPEAGVWSLTYPDPKDRFVYRPDNRLVLTAGVNRVVAGVSRKTPPLLTLRNSSRQPLKAKIGDIELTLAVDAASEPIELEGPGRVEVVYYAPHSDDKTPRTNTWTLGWGETRTEALHLERIGAVRNPVLTLCNTNDTAVFVEMSGGYGGSFWLKAGDSESREPQPGAETSIRYYANSDAYRESSPETAGTAAKTLAAGERATLNLSLTPQKRPDELAELEIRNTNAVPVHVRASGGFGAGFWLDPATNSFRRVLPGVETTLLYYANDDAFAESSEETAARIVRTLGAGQKDAVELTLTPRRHVNAMATLRLHNTNDVDVFVTALGGFSGQFWVLAGGEESRQVRPGEKTQMKWYTTSGDYEENTESAARHVEKTLAAGEESSVDLFLTRSGGGGDAMATLRFRNTNDVVVVVALSGGRKDDVWVEAGTTTNVPVRPGMETTLRYYANDRQYAQNSPETANAGTVTPKGGEMVDVDLKLTKRTYPVLQLANGGDVALAVRVAGRREPVALAAGETRKVPVYAERKFPIEWEAEEDGYLDDSRELGPYEWNKRYAETIVPARRTPPAIRVRNVTPFRGMMVTVTRASDGGTVEEFELGRGSNRVVQLPEAGRYRVQTKAKPDKRNDEEQDATRYDAIDEAVDCDWGKTKEVKCTANLRSDGGPGPGPGPDPRVLLREALTTCLSNAKMKVDEEWGEHGAVGAIAVVRDALQEAAAMGMDVDVIAGSTVPWAGWKEAVAAKRSYQTGNAEWQRIVAATEASGSWTEFFGRYPVQTRTY